MMVYISIEDATL